MQGRLVLVPPCSTASLCSCLGCSRVEISAPPVVALSLGGLEGGQSVLPPSVLQSGVQLGEEKLLPCVGMSGWLGGQGRLCCDCSGNT